MSHWYPEPRPFDRWIVRHVTGVRLGAAFLMLFGICWMVYRQAFAGSMGPFGLSVYMLLLSWKVPRSVERYDRAPHQVPNGK